MKIKLGPDAGRVDFEPADWQFYENTSFMYHAKTGVTFQVVVDEAVLGQEKANILDVSAYPVHVCDYRPKPSTEELTTLGRAAIAIWLQANTDWKPVIRTVPDDLSLN